MKLINYIKHALSPGGTPTRYLYWVIVILVAQVLASALPSGKLLVNAWNEVNTFVLISLIISVLPLFAKNESHKIAGAYVLYIVGLAVSTYTIISGLTP